MEREKQEIILYKDKQTKQTANKKQRRNKACERGGWTQ